MQAGTEIGSRRLVAPAHSPEMDLVEICLGGVFEPSQPLLVRPTIGEFESLRGYLKRLANANGIEAVIRPRLATIAKASDSIPMLAETAGQSTSVLTESGSHLRCRRSVVDKERHLFRTDCYSQYKRRTLSNRCLRSANKRAVCPHCIREGRTTPFSWELQDYSVCLRHGTKMMGTCKCGRILCWTTSICGTCLCGMPLADLVPSVGSPTRWAISSLLSHAFECEKPQSEWALGMSETLARYRPATIVGTVRALQRYVEQSMSPAFEPQSDLRRYRILILNGMLLLLTDFGFMKGLAHAVQCGGMKDWCDEPDPEAALVSCISQLDSHAALSMSEGEISEEARWAALEIYPGAQINWGRVIC